MGSNHGSPSRFPGEPSLGNPACCRVFEIRVVGLTGVPVRTVGLREAQM